MKPRPGSGAVPEAPADDAAAAPASEAVPLAEGSVSRLSASPTGKMFCHGVPHFDT